MQFKLLRMDIATQSKVETLAYFENRENAQEYADFKNKGIDSDKYFYYVF